MATIIQRKSSSPCQLATVSNPARMRSARGVTLLETLVALAIFLLASTMIFMFIAQGFRAQNFPVLHHNHPIVHKV